MAVPTSPPKDPAKLREYAREQEQHWREVREACDVLLRTLGTSTSGGSNGVAVPQPRPSMKPLKKFLSQRKRPSVRKQGLAVLLLLGPQKVRGILDALEVAGRPINKPRPHDVIRNSMKPEIGKRLDYEDATFRIKDDVARGSIAHELGIKIGGETK